MLKTPNTSDLTVFRLNDIQNASEHEIPIENMIFPPIYIPIYGYFILKNLVYKIFFGPPAPPRGECIYGIVFPVAH